MESGDRVDPSHEGRRRDHAQVVARAQADDLVVADEPHDALQIRADRREQLGSRRVLVRDFLQHFTEHDVLAVFGGLVAVVAVRGEPLRVQRKCELHHLRTRSYQLRFGVCEHLFRGRGRPERVLELLIVEFLAQPPGPVCLPCSQVAREPRVEARDRRDRRRRGPVVTRLQGRSVWNRLADRVLDEVDVARVLVYRNLDEDWIRVYEGSPCLLECAGHLLETTEDVGEACLLRRVLLGQRQEQRVADRLHLPRRIVPGVLDPLVLEQLKGDLVIDQLPVGRFLAPQSLLRCCRESSAPLAVETRLGCVTLRAEVVEHGIELDALSRHRVAMFVVTRRTGIARDHRERGVDEVGRERHEACVRVGGHG